MNRRVLIVALLATLTTAMSMGFAAEPGGKIRVLLTVGGHDYEQEPFYAVFKAMPDVTFKIARMPQDADMLKPGLEKEFDVLVMYDMCPGISPDQQKAFVDLLNRGIGVVALHHNMGAHRTWPEYRKVIGGKFFTEEAQFEGKKHGLSGWEHDQDMAIAVADSDHPITRGLKDFQIHDETYNNYWVDPAAKVLLTTNHPKNDRSIAWVTHYGKSPVFYLMLGHDGNAYANPSYRELVHRGIRWAAAR